MQFLGHQKIYKMLNEIVLYIMIPVVCVIVYVFAVADPVFFRSASTTGFRLSAYPFFILCLEPCIKGCKRSKLEQSVPDKIVRIRVSLKDSNTVRYTADSLSGMNSISLSRCIIHQHLYFLFHFLVFNRFNHLPYFGPFFIQIYCSLYSRFAYLSINCYIDSPQSSTRMLLALGLHHTSRQTLLSRPLDCQTLTIQN